MNGNQLIVLSQAFVSDFSKNEKTFLIPPQGTWDSLLKQGYLKLSEGVYDTTKKGRDYIKKCLNIDDSEEPKRGDNIVRGHEVAGLLVHGHFMCKKCAIPWLKEKPIPIYFSNIEPYSQTCFQCKFLVVNGSKDMETDKPVCLWS